MSKKIDVNKYDEMKNQSDYWEIEFNKKDLECDALKQQLTDLQKDYNELLSFAHKNEDVYIENMYKSKQQLAEKEKEIRHQVCDEIREKAKQDTHRGLYTITYADLYGIEKGGGK